jgi:hypothetical protein
MRVKVIGVSDKARKCESAVNEPDELRYFSLIGLTIACDSTGSA